MIKPKIGLFGGTFDPPHIGHMILAGESAFQFNLSRVLWALTPAPPHKQDQTVSPLDHRIAMLEVIIKEDPIFELSRLEIDRPGPHYTVDTVELLQRAEPFAEVFLLLGGDSLRGLHTWRRYSDLIAAVSKIIVLRRSTESFEFDEIDPFIRPTLKEKIEFIDSLVHTLSSREIRRRIGSGETYRYYLHPGVYAYIEANQLYRQV